MWRPKPCGVCGWWPIPSAAPASAASSRFFTTFALGRSLYSNPPWKIAIGVEACAFSPATVAFIRSVSRRSAAPPLVSPATKFTAYSSPATEHAETKE